MRTIFINTVLSKLDQYLNEMESIIINKYNSESAAEKSDIDVESSGAASNAASEDLNKSDSNDNATENHQNVSSFLKFSIQNILQQAAAANSGASAAAAAAAVAAAASRRSNDLFHHPDMAAAMMSELEMKRAMTSLPFW